MNTPAIPQPAPLAHQSADVVAQAQAFVNQLAAAAQAFDVDTDAAVEQAIAISQQIKQHEDAFDAECEKHLEHKRLAERNAKPWRACKNLLTDTRTMLRHKIQAYRDRQRAAQTAALAAITPAAAPAEVAQAVAVLAPKPAGLQEREHWSAEVVDESQLPREFWIVDKQKLDAYARTQKEAFAVPGARAVREMRPVVR